jgi:hypothetical protein
MQEIVAAYPVRYGAPSATSVAPTARPATGSRFLAVPNPFNPVTEIVFEVAGDDPVPVTLEVYSVLGRRVATLFDRVELAPGEHRVAWRGQSDDGRALASGMYFFRLETPRGVKSVKGVLIK